MVDRVILMSAAVFVLFMSAAVYVLFMSAAVYVLFMRAAVYVLFMSCGVAFGQNRTNQTVVDAVFNTRARKVFRCGFLEID